MLSQSETAHALNNKKHIASMPTSNSRFIKLRTSQILLPRILVALLVTILLAGCSREARKARLLQSAERDFKSGEYDKAKIEYMSLLRLDPRNALAVQQLGVIWLEAGAPLRAGPFLLRTRELAADNIDNRTKLARAFLSVGQIGEARKEATSILEQSPANGEALTLLVEASRSPEDIASAEQQLQKFPEPDSALAQLALAYLSLRKGDLASAERALQRALALDPKSSPAHSAMAILWLFKKDPTRAGEEFKTAAELAPIRSNARVKFAEFKAQTGGAEEAKGMLKEITRQAPDYLPAWILLGQIAFAEKQYDESLKLVENVFGRDPDNFDAGLVQVGNWLAKSETKKALEKLERLDKTYPNSPLIKFQMARANLQNKNPAQATNMLEQAIAANPDYVEAIVLLAELNLRSGNAQPVVPAMLGLLKKRSDLVQAQVLLADAYRFLGRLDDAAAVFREQIKASPQNAQPYVLLGVVLRQAKKTDEARKAFEKALELTPDSLLATTQLIELDISTRNFDNALQRIQRQLQKKPESAEVHLLEGRIYSAKGDWEQAEAALRKSIELDPKLPGAYELLVGLYVTTNRIPQAINQAQAFLSKDPNNAGALMTLALIYERHNDASKAAETYEKLLSKSPDFAPALNNLAFLYAERLNQLDKASELAHKARKLQSANPAIADTLGWILYKQGDYQQALPLLQESAEKLSEKAEIQYHLGMASYMMGQTDAARTAFQKATNSTEDFSGKEDSRRRLALMGNDTGALKDLSINELETILKDQPNDVVALVRLGDAYENQRAFDKAGTAYERALKLNPNLLPATMKLAQLNAGALQNKSRALELAKKARELAPADPRAAAVLGTIAYQAGNFAWAYSLLQESVRRLPNDPKVLHDLAWAAYSLGKVGEAQQMMERVLKASADSRESEDAKSFLAMTALDQKGKDPATAQPDVQKVLQADPTYVPALMARGAIQLGRGEASAASSTYIDILHRFPDFAPAQKRLASLYARDSANRAKAYDFAMKARNTLPDDTELAQVLAEISYERKEYGRALQLLQESARKTPLNAEGLYYLGMSYLHTKQQSEGRQALTKALSAGLPEPLAAEAKRTLAEMPPQ
jgi:tetratricopeptide (TPR) repeat protein